MKSKLLTLLVPALFIFIQSNGQYKDLEGVFFGKVIGLGTGISIQSYGEKQIGTQTPITLLTYNVILNNKSMLSTRLALHKEYTVNYVGTNYTQTAKFKYFEIESAYRRTLTKEGIEKPTSVFWMLQLGYYLGKNEFVDSRYGSDDGLPGGEVYLGAGFSVFQRLGSRIVLFAEPSYRYFIQPKMFRIYLGDDNENYVKLNHLNVHLGVMFLIGKKEE